MATAETIFSVAIPTQIIPGSIKSTQQMDPFAARIERSSKGVAKLSLGASGWYFTRLVSLGLGGIVRFSNTLGPEIRSAAQPLIVYQEAQKYPGALEATLPGVAQMQGYLAELRGNIVCDESVLRMSQADDIVVDYFADLMDGVSLRVALHKIATLYTPSSVTRHVCTVSDVSVDASGASFSFVPAEGNEVMFHEGHMIQAYKTYVDGSGNTFIASRHTPTGVDYLAAQIMVNGVDPTTRRVYAVVMDGANLLNITNNVVANGDIIVFQGQLYQSNGAGYTGGDPTANPAGTPVALGAYGFVDWLVNAGSVLGLSTSTFQRIKSIINPHVGGPWTEDEADRHFMWYYRWHRKPITDLYMTPGALLAHKKTFLGMFRADRTGKPVEIVGGHKGIAYVYNGQEVNFWTTPFMRAGYIIGQYMAEGNFQELIPPRDPSAAMGSLGENEVEFKTRGDASYMSIFRLVGYAPAGGGPVQATKLREAPFCMFFNRWPMIQIPGILAGGVSESNWTPGS